MVQLNTARDISYTGGYFSEQYCSICGQWTRLLISVIRVMTFCTLCHHFFNHFLRVVNLPVENVVVQTQVMLCVSFRHFDTAVLYNVSSDAIRCAVLWFSIPGRSLTAHLVTWKFCYMSQRWHRVWNNWKMRHLFHTAAQILFVWVPTGWGGNLRGPPPPG